MQLSLFEEETPETPETPEGVRYKTCGKCNTTLLETEDNFYKVWAYISKDGSKLQHFDNKCTSCKNKARKQQKPLQQLYGHRAYGTCDCCGVDAKDVKGGKLHLDHCHTTGEYRGHLCGSCNRGIGMLGDTRKGVQLGVDYLERVESKR